MKIERGLRSTVRRTVTDDDLALALGSGDLPVLATPRLLAWCEAACVDAIVDHVGLDQSTVGTRAQLEHTRASPAGATVAVTAELNHVDGRLLRFDLVAVEVDGVTVAHGQLTRVVVERERFLRRVQPT